jgi:hypothetical protein
MGVGLWACCLSTPVNQRAGGEPTVIDNLLFDRYMPLEMEEVPVAETDARKRVISTEAQRPTCSTTCARRDPPALQEALRVFRQGHPDDLFTRELRVFDSLR